MGDCIRTTVIAAVVCSMFFFFAGAISGCLGVTIYQQRKLRRDKQLPLTPPIYEELSGGRSAALMMRNPTLTEVDSHIELATNAAYGESLDRGKAPNAAHVESQHIELETNAAYGDSCVGLTTNAAYGQMD